MSPLEATAEPRLQGVTLEMHAAVQAGLAAGFPVDAVLANEGVEPAVYARAMQAWSDLLADDLNRDDAPLNEAYNVRLVRAQDRYGRRVDPLENNLRAWLCFVRLVSDDPDPPALFARHGLHAVDVLRLHRSWARRFELDPALLREAQTILAGEPGPLPELTLEPPRLIPPEPPRAAAFQDLEAIESDDDLAPAEDDEEPASVDADEIPPFFSRIEPLSPAAPAVSMQHRSAQAAPYAPPETAPALAAARPSRERPSDVSRPPLTLPEAEFQPPVTLRLTHEAHEAPRNPLPFSAAPPPLRVEEGPPEPRVVESPSPTQPQVTPADDLGATGPLPLIIMGWASPFQLAEARVKALEQALGPRGQETDLESTGPVFPGATRPALPFRPVPTPSAPPSPGPLNPPGVPTPAAPPLEDALSLAQYASLCAELATFPTVDEAIFRRYGLEDPQKRSAVDAGWKERLRRDSAQHDAWMKMYQHYHAYWTRRGTPPSR